MSPRTLVLAAGLVVVALFAVLAIGWCAGPGTSARPGPVGTAAGGAATPSSGLPTIAAAALPPEARSMLTLIGKGGPYRYAQDGTVFNNVEGLLPKRSNGYYHEYTVVTPGSPDRGERRLIVGHGGDVYYTGDHYASFRQVIT